MKNYEWILFDADDTLFHFDAFAGLKLMFKQFDVDFTENDYDIYQNLNKPLWVKYQNNTITAQQLQHQRFDDWAKKLNVTSATLNSAFLSAMADICEPIEGAIDLLNVLKNKTKLGIITNGFAELQHIRLERTGLKNHFDILVISEQVGVAKPHLDIFNHAISLMGNPNREKILMVGDNFDSDILGGINAGLDTCWINTHNKKIPEGITPTYQVDSLIQLQKLLTKS